MCVEILILVVPNLTDIVTEQKLINPLKTKGRPVYLKTQFVPRGKTSQLGYKKNNRFMIQVAQGAVCSQINIKHTNTVWTERTVLEL